MNTFHLRLTILMFVFLSALCYRTNAQSDIALIDKIQIPYQAERTNLWEYGCKMPLTFQLPEAATLIKSSDNVSCIITLENGGSIGIDLYDIKDVPIGKQTCILKTIEQFKNEDKENTLNNRFIKGYSIYLEEDNGIVYRKPSSFSDSKNGRNIFSYFLKDDEAVYFIKIPPIAAVDEDYEKCHKFIRSFAIAPRCTNLPLKLQPSDTIIDMSQKKFPLKIALATGAKFTTTGYDRCDVFIETKNERRIRVMQKQKYKTLTTLLDEYKGYSESSLHFKSFIHEEQRGFIVEYKSEYSPVTEYQIFYIHESPNYYYLLDMKFKNNYKNKNTIIELATVKRMFTRFKNTVVGFPCT